MCFKNLAKYYRQKRRSLIEYNIFQKVPYVHRNITHETYNNDLMLKINIVRIVFQYHLPSFLRGWHYRQNARGDTWKANYDYRYHDKDYVQYIKNFTTSLH